MCYRVLLVDDDKTIRAGLKSIIAKYAEHFEVVGEAQNGAEALEAVKHLLPDVLITDIKMPVMDGVELIKNLHESGADLKMIVLSGYDEFSYVRECMKYGAVDYWLKPVDKQALKQGLEEIRSRLTAESKLKMESRTRDSQVDFYEREKTFLDLLSQERLDPQQAQVLLSLGLKPGDSCIVACLVVTTNDDLIATDTLAYGLLCKEITTLTQGFVMVCTMKERIWLAIFGDNGTLNPDDENASWRGAIERFRASIRHLRNDEVTFGYSRMYHGYEHMIEAAAEAESALRRIYYEGCGNSYHYVQEASSMSEASYEEGLRPDLDNLLSVFELGDVARSKAVAEKLVEAFKARRPSKELFAKLLYSLRTRLSVIETKDSEKLGSMPEEYALYLKYATADYLSRHVVGSIIEAAERIRSRRTGKSARVIEGAKAFIQSRYTESISLKDVASFVNLNPNYFSEFFKNETGRNFVDFLIETRLEEAKRLLSETDTKVYEIATRVGYEDVASFNRAFKRVMGISPLEYRKLAD